MYQQLLQRHLGAADLRRSFRHDARVSDGSGTVRPTHPNVPSPSFFPMSYAAKVDVPSKALPYASCSSCKDGRENFLGQTGPRGIESVRAKGCGVDALVVGFR
jgi:hypothetical protein